MNKLFDLCKTVCPHQSIYMIDTEEPIQFCLKNIRSRERIGEELIDTELLNRLYNYQKEYYNDWQLAKTTFNITPHLKVLFEEQRFNDYEQSCLDSFLILLNSIIKFYPNN